MLLIASIFFSLLLQKFHFFSVSMVLFCIRILEPGLKFSKMSSNTVVVIKISVLVTLFHHFIFLKLLIHDSNLE